MLLTSHCKDSVFITPWFYIIFYNNDFLERIINSK